MRRIHQSFEQGSNTFARRGETLPEAVEHELMTSTDGLNQRHLRLLIGIFEVSAPRFVPDVIKQTPRRVERRASVRHSLQEEPHVFRATGPRGDAVRAVTLRTLALQPFG